MAPPVKAWRLVVLESPYAGDVAMNERYARACIADCLSRGDAPVAGHLLYTQPGVLNDSIPSERATGISAGHAWVARADAIVVYRDLYMSQGMRSAIELAQSLGIAIETRYLPPDRYLGFVRESKRWAEAHKPAGAEVP